MAIKSLRKVVEKGNNWGIYAFPYAGSNAALYFSWRPYIAKGCSLYAIQLPGRADRFREKPLTRIDSMAVEVAKDIIGHNAKNNFNNICLMGHSFGSVLAFEVALLLLEQGIEIQYFIASAGSPPNARGAKNGKETKKIHALSDSEFKRYLLNQGGTPKSVLENKDLMDVLLPTLRGDFEAIYGYSRDPGEKISCPLTIFYGSKDYSCSLELLKGWQDFFQGECSQVEFEGGHFFVHDCTKEIVSTLMNNLQQLS